MFRGKSSLHVPQGVGKYFDPNHLCGYFNDLTFKIKFDPKYVSDLSVPKVMGEEGEFIFPVAVFQYALGCYDLFLETGDLVYRNEFLKLADWAIDNQKEQGQFNNFKSDIEQYRYSAMAQGEAASLLCRAYLCSERETYLVAAKKSIDFMLLNIYNGGTSSYDDRGIILYEYVDRPPVLNGWIFAAYGLRDLFLTTNDEKYQLLFMKTVNRLKLELFKYDNGYWSMYDNNHIIASPFYHNLHIAQLKCLYLSTGIDDFEIMSKRYEDYRSKFFNRSKAFLTKAIQKLKEK